MEGVGVLNKYFYYDESPIVPSYVILRPDLTQIPNGKMVSSWNILPARLLCISYADYLRFCRDILGAMVIGKNTRYPIPYFKVNKEFRQFVRLLNKRVELILWEKEHPDFWEHTSPKEFEEAYVAVWERTPRKQ